VFGNMKHVADWDLVARARDGELQAFEELVGRYQSPLIHFCYRMAGSVEDAEDLAQETFIRVHRHLDRLRPEAKFSTVLFGIARNLTLNYLRDSKRRGRGKTASLGYVSSNELQLRDPQHQADHAARSRETQVLIERGLELLSVEHREVILLREVEGMDYETIAAVLRCRKGTVKSRLARARAQLRERIVELGGEIV
jgi:RNA polymerase sigma-70 factor (ECF subfamily)